MTDLPPDAAPDSHAVAPVSPEVLASLADAETTLARTLRAAREAAAADPPPPNAIRDLNYAATALRRLIDIRKLLHEAQRDAQDQQHTPIDSGPVRFQQVLEQLAAEDREDDAPEPLPE